MEKIWDLASIHYHDSDIEKVVYKEHKVDGNHVDSSTREYAFTIQDTNDPILYSGGYICVDIKIIKTNNSSIDEDNITLENMGNLFSRSTLYIGSTVVEEIEKPSLVHHINGLINFTKDYETNEATNMLFYKDTNDSTDRQYLKFEGAHADAEKMNTLITKIKLNENYNKGFDERWKLTKNSRLNKIYIPLYQLFGFLNDYRKLIKGINFKFVFMKNDYINNMIITDIAPDANTNIVNYKIRITKISLWLPHITLNPEADILFNENFLKSDNVQLIEWISPLLKESNRIESNEDSGTITIKSTSDEVVNILVIPQYIERENNPNKSILIFDHLDIKRCYITINDTIYPCNDYEANFDENKYPNYYSDFLKTTKGKGLVSYREYGKLYPIICISTINHKPYTSTTHLNIEFTWNLRSKPTKPFKFYFILDEKRRGKMNLYKSQFECLHTLKN